MIRFQINQTEDLRTIITVGTVTAPPCILQMDLKAAGIDIPYTEAEKLVHNLNLGMASVSSAFAELNLKDLTENNEKHKGGRIRVADASALKGIKGGKQ